MATSSMIQYLSAKNDQVGASNRRVTEQFFAGGAIAIGDAVCFDTTQTGADRVLFVVQSDSDAVATQQPIGICIAHNGSAAAAVSGDEVTVVVQGYAEGVKCAAGVVARHLLRATGTVGEVDDYTSGGVTAVTPFAIALEAVAGSKVDVCVLGYFT